MKVRSSPLFDLISLSARELIAWITCFLSGFA